MEVHAHSHTPRNKWTHYLWEFIMLFLAVFCGFLAEYQLEHKIEKERGKQYIKSFVEDLKTDTSNFAKLIDLYEKKAAVLETMSSCYNSVIGTVSSDSCILTLFLYSANFPDFIYTDRTLQQLKNAGGLRLIPDADADSITDYDKLLRQYERIESTSFQETQSSIRNTIFSLNNYNVTINHVYSKDPSRNHVMFSDDKALLNRYFNQLFFYFEGIRSNITDIKEINRRATGLLKFLQNKYHLN